MHKNTAKCFILFLLLCCVHAARAQASLPKLFINEFMAANTKSTLSPVYHDYADWLEVYNGGFTTVDLSGMYLTDDPGNAKKWQIPGGTILFPGKLALFWADNRDSSLHTNFKLAKEGGYIGLCANDAVIDQVVYGPQKSDYSCGRFPDAGSNWYFYATPSPGLPNANSGYLGQARNPEFSKSGGFYHGAQSIVISAESADAVIYYTRDGSLPTMRSAIYSTPILLDSTTVLRAQVVRPGYLNSMVITHTYFINETTTLPVVSIATDPANLWDDMIGIYVIGKNGVTGYCSSAPRNWNQPWERPISLEMFEADETPGFKLDAGMQIGGGCTRLYAQKPLAIYARDEYGTAKIHYKIFPDKPIDTFNNILLRNNGQDWWRGMFRDGLMHTLVKHHMDIDWLAYKPAILFLNGAYWGIHDIREKHNEHYLAANYGIDPDEIDILNGNASVDQGSANLYTDMIRFVETHDMSLPANYSWIKTQIDMHEYLDYNIAEIYFANIDWPGGNIEYWRPWGEGHRWRWILFDTDLGFGAHQQGQFDSNTLENATSEKGTYYANPPWSTLLLRKLLQNAEFRNEFIQRFAGHLNTTFKPQRVLHIIDSLKAGIEPELPRHVKKWPQSTSFNGGWSYHINIMRGFAEKRPAQVLNHIIKKFGLTGTAQLTVQNPTPDGGMILLNGIKLESTDFNGLYFKGIPIPCQARAYPGYRFAGWQEAASSQDDSITITLSQDALLRALFVADETKHYSGLHINEILALNSTTNLDENGEHDDWIELHNSSSFAVDIGGLFVTDNLSTMNKWRIPDTAPAITTIEPGGYKILWADDNPDQGPLHLGFKLSGDGEEIGLSHQTSSGLEILDSLIFAQQTTDISFGRISENSDQWRFYNTPTPGYANTITRVAAAAIVPAAQALLLPIYPNPFNTETRISYVLANECHVTLVVFDATGREMTTLVNRPQHAGTHTVAVNGQDWASGIYFCRLITDTQTQIRKILLLR